MTTEDLKNIKKMQQAIRYWQRELREIRSQSYVRSPQLTGMPGAHNGADQVSQRALQAAEIEARILRIQKQLEQELRAVMAWIEDIDDPVVQVIIYARFVKGKSWTGVAREVGGDNTPDSVRMMFSRFVRSVRF